MYYVLQRGECLVLRKTLCEMLGSLMVDVVEAQTANGIWVEVLRSLDTYEDGFNLASEL